MGNRGLMAAALLLAVLPAVRADEADRCRADSARGIKERDIERKLVSPVNLNFQDTPLRRAIADIRSGQSIDIVLDKAALEQEGVNLDAPISMKLECVSLKSALRLVLEQMRLTYVVEDGVLKVTTRQRARGPLVQRVYSVADLVIPIEGCPRPASCPAQACEKTTGTATVQRGVKPQQTTEDQLIKLIVNSICPHSWCEVGGCGTIEYYPLGMALVINQTADIHEQVADLLTALRRLQDVEIVLEVRLVSLAEGMCERITKELGVECKQCEPKCGRPFAMTFLNEKDLFKFMETAQGDRRTNIMCAPKLTTFNGQMATIDVTERPDFVTNVEVIRLGGKIAFIPRNDPVGFHMTVQPVASADHRKVMINLKGSLTEIEGNPVAPKIVTVLHMDNTGMEIPAGATALISGGWTRQREHRTETSPPVMNKVPYVNRLFKNVGYSRETEEVMLMVTPRIVVQKEEEVRPVGFAASAAVQAAAAPAAYSSIPPAGTTSAAPSRSVFGTTSQLVPAEKQGGVIAKCEEMKQSRVAELMAAATALYKEGKYKDAQHKAMLAKELDPDNTAVSAFLAVARKCMEAQPVPAMQKKVAKLVEKYHQACAEGRLDDARVLAAKALALDPACFRRDR